VLYLIPYINSNNDLLWECGSAAMPTTATLAGSGTRTSTTVLPQYLPTSCHS
jgi:hypothetical protein